jgi:hypothetical protein
MRQTKEILKIDKNTPFVVAPNNGNPPILGVEVKSPPRRTFNWGGKR